MEEKTLGQLAAALYASPINGGKLYTWEEIADAVIAEYERRRWKAIESAPRARQYILAYSPERKMSFQVCWDHEWGYWQIIGGGKCTMEFTHWAPSPAPPKEADHGN